MSDEARLAQEEEPNADQPPPSAKEWESGGYRFRKEGDARSHTEVSVTTITNPERVDLKRLMKSQSQKDLEKEKRVSAKLQEAVEQEADDLMAAVNSLKKASYPKNKTREESRLQQLDIAQGQLKRFFEKHAPPTQSLQSEETATEDSAVDFIDERNKVFAARRAEEDAEDPFSEGAVYRRKRYSKGGKDDKEEGEESPPSSPPRIKE